ncbi:MAG: hypothetical protein KDB21_11035 [Acidimicrobiales bacterium]|nr:hypothetical protein [Acidimicrobiales bacterium]
MVKESDRSGADDVSELRRELRQIREELAALRRTASREDEGGPVSRRALFGLAGAGVAGAVVAATASPAAAADGDSILAGQAASATLPTSLITTTTSAGFVVNSQSAGTASAIVATAIGNGNGVAAVSTGGRGLLASGSLAQLRLLPAGSPGAPTTGAHELGDLYLDADGTLLLCVEAGTPGTFRYLGGNDAGMLLLAQTNSASSPTTLDGALSVSALNVKPNLTTPNPLPDSSATGDVFVDAGGNLWYCTTGGTPGTWQPLAGVSASYVPIDPERVYDSRWPDPSWQVGAPALPPAFVGGPLGTGESRTVRVGNGRDAVGQITDVVREGAKAITYNLTVVGTIGRGFLTVNPGTSAAAETAALNWNGDNVVLGNAGNVKLGASRDITVVCGGTTASTGFVIDVTGYYL